MSLPQPMRIAVLGVGGIGSAFAYQLSRIGGHDVTVIGRPQSTRYQQLKRDRGIVKADGAHAELQVLDKLDETIPYDLIIVTLLAHQIGPVLPALQRSCAKRILFMFNNFEPERLRDAVGINRAAFGMPFIQAFLSDDGKLHSTIGAGGQKTLLSEQELVHLFDRSGLPADLETNMLDWLRSHVPMCIAFESVSIAGMRRGGGASWGESMTLSRGVHECFKLIKGLGYKVYPVAKTRIDSSPIWVFASILWSVSRIKSFRELLASGAGECRALVDVLLSAAPHSKLLIAVNLIEAMRPSSQPNAV